MERTSLLTGLLALLLGASVSPADDQIEFNRDIRPLLSDACFACHGPDENTREGSLRLDQAAAASSVLPSGMRAVDPGKPLSSELVRRIFATDPETVMPPPETGKRLTEPQKALLKRWIEQGAPYEAHWSFTPVKRPRVPQAPVDLVDWSRSPLDAFLLQQILKEQARPAPVADQYRLLRRVTLDLTGLPPTPEDLAEFTENPDPDALEQLVDRLIASPHYGERMALEWLDAARYADTHGFNNDTTRYMWRWRDWTIDAMNSGMPYDQFLTEQLAGDLLPAPTLNQRIATGFNRNHVINSEGGIIPEEYRVEYVADRVHTTATILMGVSLSCARCHDHKFDPFTQREYYQFFAFFNNLNEQGEAGRVGNAEPTIPAPTSDQSELQQRLARQLADLDRSLAERTARARETQADWEPRLRESYITRATVPEPQFHWPLDEARDAVVASRNPELHGQFVGKPQWVPGRSGNAAEFDGNSHIEAGDVASFERSDPYSFGAWVHLASRDAATVISRMDDAGAHRGYDLLLVGGKLTAHLVHHWPDNALHVVSKAEVPINQWKHVFVTYDGSSRAEGLRLYVDGVLQEVEITHRHLDGSVRTARPVRIGRRTSGAPLRGKIDDVRIYDRELTAAEVALVAGTDGVREILDLPVAERSAEQTETLVRAYLDQHDPASRTDREQRAEIQKRQADLNQAIPSAMVMQEMPKPRPTFLLKRGQYDLPGEPVEPATPASLPPFPATAPRNRLGLTQWLLAPEHPLTSRVAVNRIWAQFFGIGLVETVEDFGSQGEWPLQMDLLNWLAADYAAYDQPALPRWDTRRIHRLIVTSAAYRQSSTVSPDLRDRDPANRLLARGPRFRLPAEAIRDQALAIAGLMSDRIGGPSVSPYQPAGLWDDVAVGADYEGTVYRQDRGEGLYRRSMYTFWKRTCPPPGLNTFDAPEREVCTARRSRTNTPLQALVLMNDPTYLEAARKAAERVLVHGGATLESRVAFAFQLVLSRPCKPEEVQIAARLVEQRRAWFRQHPADAAALLKVGESPRLESLAPDDLAAWTSLMSVMLNLDETITKS